MRIGLTACSDGQKEAWRPQNEQLSAVLAKMGIEAVFSSCIYEKDGSRSGSGAERAKALTDFFADPSIDLICDISGGDIANEVLCHLDFETIARNPKPFFGYSDLTTLVNGIYRKTGSKTVLYQIKNLVYVDSEQQQSVFSETILGGKDTLYQFPYTFLQGDQMEGIIVGGNIRCLLKLAGTEFFPDMKGKLLLLEALGGGEQQLITYFSQLKLMGVFEQVSGIILGSFTKYEAASPEKNVFSLLSSFISPNLPVIKTSRIGHGADSRAVVIGEHRSFFR